MNEMETYLEKLNAAAAECSLIASRASGPVKKRLFARLAEHLEYLAWEVAETMAKVNE